MNTEGTQPPALALFLLRHLSPKDNREVLIGDLLEGFHEGRSDGWFWRQVLIALVVGASKGFTFGWLQICFGLSGTVVFVLRSWINRTHSIERLWLLGLSLPTPSWRIAYMFFFDPVLVMLMLVPLLAVLLLFARRFSWYSLLRTISISFLLLVVTDAALWTWGPIFKLEYRPPPATFRAFLIDVLQVRSAHFMLLIPLFILTISAALGCSSPVRGRHYAR